MRALLFVIVSLLSVNPALAQTEGAPAAPKDRAVDFPSASLDQDARDLAIKKLITKRVLEGGTFSINVRHIEGSETALQHGSITEVWVVREGSGIVSTGGTLVNPAPGAAKGEFRGAAIQGGQERRIKPGDIIFIPPGVPHGIKETTSITYMNIRFEAK